MRPTRSGLSGLGLSDAPPKNAICSGLPLARTPVVLTLKYSPGFAAMYASASNAAPMVARPLASSSQPPGPTCCCTTPRFGGSSPGASSPTTHPATTPKMHNPPATALRQRFIMGPRTLAVPMCNDGARVTPRLHGAHTLGDPATPIRRAGSACHCRVGRHGLLRAAPERQGKYERALRPCAGELGSCPVEDGGVGGAHRRHLDPHAGRALRHRDRQRQPAGDQRADGG